MQRIFIDNHDRVLYYSNPAGYIAEKEAVVDTMFQTQELERFLQKQSLTIHWEDGVYDRILLGQRGGRFDPEAPPLKSCRVWQLTRDSPINMRFIPYEALLERFGQPDRKHYETVYDGLVGTNDPEEIYTLFRDPVPGYDGRPIGISDVLELYDADGSEFYYCDRVGFRQIEFAPQQEMDLCPCIEHPDGCFFNINIRNRRKEKCPRTRPKQALLFPRRKAGPPCPSMSESIP